VVDIDGIVAAPASAGAGGIAVRSGCLELIASMRDRGVPVAAAGTGEPESIDRFFRSAGLVGFFDVVVCGDEVWRLPPAPDLLELAAYRVGWRRPGASCSGARRAVWRPRVRWAWTRGVWCASRSSRRDQPGRIQGRSASSLPWTPLVIGSFNG